VSCIGPQQEAQPKTVYFDRLDFTHGVPHRKEGTEEK
jgi:hypothetical protein